VMKPWADFSRVPNAVLNSAADRGTRVHAYCSAIALGLGTYYIDEDCEGYVASFIRWYGLQVQEALHVEETFTSALGYVAHPDLVVLLSDGRLALVDLKTPVAHKRLWEAQLAACRRAVMEKRGYRELCAGSLQLHPDGHSPKMRWLDEKQEAQAFNAFLGALNAWNYFSRQAV
jgi:hypothetical protein